MEADPLQRASQLRVAGEAARRKDGPAAERLYGEAVQLLRRGDTPRILLAHTIRHLGDVFLENGNVEVAGRYLEEALGLYRTEITAPRLELANAIRSLAVYRTKVGLVASPLWQEARDLYAAVGIEAGVRECDLRLQADLA